MVQVYGKKMNRSRLLFEISQALDRHPPIESLRELRKEFVIPKNARSLAVLSQILEDAKAARLKRREQKADRIWELWNVKLPPTKAAIGREVGASREYVSQVIKKRTK